MEFKLSYSGLDIICVQSVFNDAVRETMVFLS